MKMIRNLLPIVFVLSSVLVAAPVHADLNQRVEVRIPFRFSVEDTSLPPGRYVFEPIGSGASSALKIEKVGQPNARVIVLTRNTVRNDAKMAEAPQLVFERTGRTRFLRAVYDGSSAGAELNPPSPQTLRVARAVAAPKLAATARKQVPAAVVSAKPCPCKEPATTASR